ncbi:MAG TPA: FkbM family methyltransferase [Chloroflexota bacterium]|nr:FkbM family methyltransferase [Chloroflexota bacterium]
MIETARPLPTSGPATSLDSRWMVRTSLLSRAMNRLQRGRRLRLLRGTPAERLRTGHISSLELLAITRADEPRMAYDIGASTGTWTLLAKAILPAIQVHAFEPLPEQADCFARASRRLTGVHLHRTALGSRTERHPMHVTDSPDSSSLLAPTPRLRAGFGVEVVTSRTVPVERLDDFVDRERLPLPDLIKLDVQGGELAVLEGGAACLSHARWLVVEVSFVPFYENQPLFHDIVCHLADRNFYLHALSVDTPRGAPLVQTDVLFSRCTSS